VFFCNSGTEAVEGAIKIARKWGMKTGKSTMVGMSNAFHGRTYGALSLMDRSSYREGFGPFLGGFLSVTFNDTAALRQNVNTSTAAVILEFIQGEGGIRPVSPGFVEMLLALQEEYGFLILADEIQSGVGRTGKFFGFEHFGARPDLVTMAKPIGGGLPLGAILGGPRVADVLQPGNHGTTFGGNPVACAAGIAVLSEIADRGLQDHARRMGEIFLTLLRDLGAQYPDLVREVRGYGLMVGLELTREGDPAVAAMRERGILINCTDKTVLRFVPPLTIQEAEIRRTVETLGKVFAAWA
jgi:acetylornithine aminotransferase